MRVAFVNSGLGVLAPAVELRRLRPDADLVLSIDPDGMPWGPRSAADITERTVRCAAAALHLRPGVMVIACNTASVHAIDAVRARLEPRIPVIGTVPAVKPAAARGGRVSVWATAATSTSQYQGRLINDFAPGRPVESITCHGLADAVDAGEEARIDRAITSAAARTSPDTTDVVLGCTEYELIADRIATALPGHVRLHGSAAAVAAQILRRAPDPAPGSGQLDVLLSGRPGALPAAAQHYAPGRELLMTSLGDLRTRP